MVYSDNDRPVVELFPKGEEPHCGRCNAAVDAFDWLLAQIGEPAERIWLNVEHLRDEKKRLETEGKKGPGEAHGG